jgi:glycosyltransferase involved in cell wall biosynthesis
MTNIPTISVLMGAYNGARFIEETLASLQAQTFTDFEIIVVDDKSTDDTLEVLKRWPDPRLRIIALAQNGGVTHARNRALGEARGRYIAATDQDDLSLPERFARQVAYLDAHPGTAVVGTGVAWLVDGVAKPSPYSAHTTPALVDWLLHIENPLAWSSVMIRADMARRLDPFCRPEALYAEDFDLYHRLRTHGAVARLDEEFLLYRVHAAGASQRYTRIMTDNAAASLHTALVPLIGDEAGPLAPLLVEHMMRRWPVPDRATLMDLGARLARLQAAWLAANPVSRDDHKLIRWETARRWARIVRAGLRTGTITLGDAVAARPEHMGLGHAGLDDLIWSRMIGAARAARRRRAGQTFVA